MSRPLDLTASWPVENVAAAVVHRGVAIDSIGATDRAFRLASVGKTIVAWTCLVAVEEGTMSLDDRIGPDDGHVRTIRHALSHAGGFGFNAGDTFSAPERRRMYGNAGIEAGADHLAAQASMSFDEYLSLGVLQPLGMTSTDVRGSPAFQMWSTVDDLVRFIGEITNPTLISAATAAESIRPHFPALGGIVPGVGRFDTCPWGLGFEIRGGKQPHWTGARNTPTTYGHFGGSGTMLWVDPGNRDLAVVALTDRPFDEWADDALRLWPELSDAVIEQTVT